jgi:peptidoglycan/xylan/chitin deacetylase (PgdA/CDA1 family)
MSAPRFQWPDGNRCACVICFDVDAESAVLQVGRKDATHATTMSHQAYGPRVGVPRLLEQLRAADIRATFFVPGFTAECYPDTIRRIVADGHEVGWHGYMHELPLDLTDAEQRSVLERGAEVLEPLTGERPVGYRAPWWQLTLESLGLLASPARTRTIGRFAAFARELGGVCFATARGRRARPRRPGRVRGPPPALGAGSRLRDARSGRDPAPGTYLSRRESRRSLSSLPSV